MIILTPTEVSIPSKREGTCELKPKVFRRRFKRFVSIPSKREGTCEHSKTKAQPAKPTLTSVSIPSKREGTCELQLAFDRYYYPIVSIPSKREGTCEHDPTILVRKR